MSPICRLLTAPLIRFTRGKVAVYNAHVWSIADRHGARVLDLWGMQALQDWRMWAPDRIHLSTEGHRRVGVNPDTLRGWCKQADIDAGRLPGVSTADAARIRELEREVKELKRANEILLAASSFFARELDPRLPW